MAGDDIERLLAEINAGGTPSRQPQRRTPSEVEQAGGRGGRLAFAVVMAIALGFGTWVLGVFIPFVGAVGTGIGGAIAAFVTALIAGPPRWFSS